MNAEEFNRKNKDKNSITVVLSQPRSGSTLLMRLMGLACMTPVRGDLPPDFIQSFINLYDSIKADKGIYDHLSNLEEKGTFSDQYRGWHQWGDKVRMDEYHLRSLLLGGSNGFLKTCLGFGNHLVAPFVQTLRSICDNNSIRLKIAFLYRDHFEIEKSLLEKWDKEGMTPDMHAHDLIEVVHQQLQDQRQQFDDCFELGDMKIKYEDILSKSKDILLKLYPRYYPDENIIRKVLAKKIK